MVIRQYFKRLYFHQKHFEIDLAVVKRDLMSATKQMDGNIIFFYLPGFQILKWNGILSFQQFKQV